MKRRKGSVKFILLMILIISGAVMICGCRNADEGRSPHYLNDDTNKYEKDITSDTKTKKVGVVMPTRSAQRWIDDGANMKAKLETLGYTVDLQYAEDDIDLQISQIDNMINYGVDCLVVASIDSAALVDSLARAEHHNIPVIAYDRLLMGTSAVSYYASFDNKEVGRLIGSYIEKEKELADAGKEGRSYNIELFMGSPDDNNAHMLYDGAMEVLKPYFNSGVLKCRSGRTSFDSTCILRWSEQTANERCGQILDMYYKTEKLDIACSAYDGFSYGIGDALREHGYGAEDWPLITGQDADRAAISDIIDGSQTMTIYKDTRELAAKCVSMVEAVLNGTQPEINDTDQYDNGVKKVPSYLCVPVTVDKANYEKVLIDGGYYTRKQLKE